MEVWMERKSTHNCSADFPEDLLTIAPTSQAYATRVLPMWVTHWVHATESSSLWRCMHS